MSRKKNDQLLDRDARNGNFKLKRRPRVPRIKDTYFKEAIKKFQPLPPKEPIQVALDETLLSAERQPVSIIELQATFRKKANEHLSQSSNKGE